MVGKIFINYRRGDDPGFTQALYQRLEQEFPTGDLFMDIEGHIKPGDDFVQVLGRQVAACDVLLAVIGPRWADLMAARASDPDDFVAIEIKAALDQNKRVIPVLVGGAAMPRADALPEPIRALARRNAVGLRPERFKADCQGLVTALKEQLAARSGAERAAADAERRKREAEEAARMAAVEQRARAEASAGLSPEEIRKAEELASWDFIKSRNDVQALRDHLARFPRGATTLYALTKLEDLAWAALGSSPGVELLQAFLEEFPQGAHAEAGRTRLAAIEQEIAQARAAEERRVQETAEWSKVAANTDPGEIEAFLADWPSGQHAEAARGRLRELKAHATRRWLVKALAGGVATTAAVGSVGFAALVPGQPIWRLIHDRSVRTLSGRSLRWRSRRTTGTRSPAAGIAPSRSGTWKAAVSYAPSRGIPTTLFQSL